MSIRKIPVVRASAGVRLHKTRALMAFRTVGVWTWIRGPAPLNAVSRPLPAVLIILRFLSLHPWCPPLKIRVTLSISNPVVKMKLDTFPLWPPSTSLLHWVAPRLPNTSLWSLSRLFQLHSKGDYPDQHPKSPPAWKEERVTVLSLPWISPIPSIYWCH